MAKSVYFGVNSKAQKVKKLYIGVDGKARQIKKAYIGVNGIARLFYQNGLPLSGLPVGALVQIKDSNITAPFYVAKHNYESGLNGTGRTLMVRGKISHSRVWDSTYGSEGMFTNEFNGSDIDVWLNGAYKSSIPSTIQTLIGTTKFVYTPGTSGSSVATTTLERSVFLLSLYELGLTATNANNEGSILPIASTLRTSTMNQLTRTRKLKESAAVYAVNTQGAAYIEAVNVQVGVAPCFTLPATALVDATPNADGSYNLLV